MLNHFVNYRIQALPKADAYANAMPIRNVCKLP